MEIWIIGIPLVILMVFLSTRIKKLANQAYGEELIERQGFALIKPEGLIALENPEEGFQFQAESKGFGQREETESFREASASVSINDVGIEPVVSKLLEMPNVEVILRSEDGCSVRYRDSEGEVVKHVFRRVMSKGTSRHIELRVTVLDESIDEFEEGAKAMIRSLREN